MNIILKDFFTVQSEHIEYITGEYKMYLPHENDGLVFTKIKSTYKPGTDESILKWKPVEMYTLDCLLVPLQD